VSDELKPVYLLTGSDRPKIERALRRLRDRFDSEAAVLLAAPETSGDDAVAACNSLGLFGGERLVVVDAVERWRAEDAKAVAAYAPDPAPGTVLALVAAGLRKDSPLTKTVAKHGDVLVYDVERKKMIDWVVQQFAGHGVKVDREFSRSLLDAVVPEGQDPDLHHLANEVAKLVTWADGESLEWESVRELVVPFGEVPSFALIAAPRRLTAPRGRARPPPRPAPGMQEPARRGTRSAGDRLAPEAPPVLRPEARPAGGRLHRRRAARRRGAPGRARPRAQGRLAARRRPRARASPGRRDARARGLS
jgi:hypothetical protein